MILISFVVYYGLEYYVLLGGSFSLCIIMCSMGDGYPMGEIEDVPFPGPGVCYLCSRVPPGRDNASLWESVIPANGVYFVMLCK